MQIKITKFAEDDLYQVEEFISIESPKIALKIINQILEAIELLSSFPKIGRKGRVSETRELIVTRTPFIIIYQLVEKYIVVLRIIHSSQRWPVKVNEELSIVL